MSRQLIIISDMEGASGIFDGDRTALLPGHDDWEKRGRDCLTSDVAAVCRAAVDFGIGDILLYDGHHAGNPLFNIRLEQLPGEVRVFDVPNREFHWRRIRGQAAWQPFGLITVGQHARNGEPDAYFPHTIQSPPIQALWVNGRHVAEIGMDAYQFIGTPYLANIGCQASMKEAAEVCATVEQIPVKDKRRGWEPPPGETAPLIYDGVRRALEAQGNKEVIALEGPYEFSMELTPGYRFVPPGRLTWVGSFTPRQAFWTAPEPEIGFELFHTVRDCIVKQE